MIKISREKVYIDIPRVTAGIGGIFMAFLVLKSITYEPVTSLVPKKISISIKAPEAKEEVKDNNVDPKPVSSPGSEVKVPKSAPKKVEPILPVLPSAIEDTPEPPSIESPPDSEVLPDIPAVDDEPLPDLLLPEDKVISSNNTISQPPILSEAPKTTVTPSDISDMIKKGTIEQGDSLIMEFEIDRTGTILNVRPVRLSRNYLFNITMLIGSMGKIYKVPDAEGLQLGQTIWVRLPPLTPVDRDKPMIP